MSPDDDELINAANAAIASRYKLDWHVVGAALRLRSGELVTGIHLDTGIGRIAGHSADGQSWGHDQASAGSYDVAGRILRHQADGRQV